MYTYTTGIHFDFWDLEFSKMELIRSGGKQCKTDENAY
jgi:hypothetical protein